MHNNSVSVIIITYNYGSFIKRAIDSVLSQTFRDFEIFVIDDGSTDNTREIVEAIIASTASVNISYQYQANKGPNAARNLGISLSRGTYIAFLDSDDEWLTDKLEKQFRFMEANQSVGMVGCGFKWITDQGDIITEVQAPTPPPQELLIRHLMIRNFNFGGTSALMIRRACFEKTGYFDEALRGSEDRDMWLRIAQQFPISNIADVLIVIHSHDSNSHTRYRIMLDSRLKFIRKHFLLQPLPFRLLAISYAFLDAAHESQKVNHRWMMLYYALISIFAYPLKTSDIDDKYLLICKAFVPSLLVRLVKSFKGKHHAC